MKSSIPKPLLRVATAGAAVGTTNPPYPRSALSLTSRFPTSTPASPSSSSSSTSTSLTRPTNMHFLRRTFASHTYPPPYKHKALIPLGLALIGGAMLFLSTSTVQALSFSPFSSKSTGSTRMKERLAKHGFVEKLVNPDGNCQMRAISDQIFGDENRHQEVRRKVMDWLSVHEKFAVDDEGGATLGDFIDRDHFPKWNSYISYMSQNGAWGDHITLLGAAESYGVNITVLSNVDGNAEDQYITFIKPRSTKPTKNIYLSHWHEMHYNSLYPANQMQREAA